VLISENILPEFIRNPNTERFLTDDYLVADLETTNLDTGDAVNPNNRIVYGYVYSSKYGNFDIHSELDLLKLEDLFYEVDLVVAQGAKFELKWAKRVGIRINRFLPYDTMLGDYVRAGNRKWRLDLGSISRRYGGRGKASFVSNLIDAGVCPSEIPPKALKAYCRQDVKETLSIFLKQREILKKEGLLAPMYLRCITTPVLADIELRGIHLDKQMVEKVHNEYSTRYNEISRELEQITGGINMASSQQVAKFLYEDLKFEEVKDRKGKPIRNKGNKKTPEGTRKTDEDTINLLKPKTEGQKKFLKLKLEESKLRKKITSYTSNFLEACEKNNCMVHGSLNQAVSGTHRLTSSAPNLQNVDIQLKKCVDTREEGYGIRNADYKGLEMVGAGLLAQDKQCLIDIQTKHDFHSYTASIIDPKGWEKAGRSKSTPLGEAIRRNSKKHTFKPLFNGRSGTKQEQAYYAEFRKRYPDISKMQEGWVVEVLRDKSLTTVTGLKFYWPDCRMKGDGYVTRSTEIYNYPIQNISTAEIAPTGVCILWHYLNAAGLKSFIINEVHDSVLIEEYLKESELLEPLVVQAMTQDVVWFFDKLIGFSINFPLEIEQDISSHWGHNEVEELEAA
jgi:DNA polymerase-1